ncbi:hypothetical protein STBA_59290 [Streptomyces sp. MP131-18]|nr:hypothetical protein STBA_59290 [Streptomyces sp. MP131-18]
MVLTAEGEVARDRALAVLATEFHRRLAKISPHDRTELHRILLALRSPRGSSAHIWP